MGWIALQWISVDETNYTMHCMVICPLGRFFGALKNWGQQISYRKLYKKVAKSEAQVRVF